MIGILLLVAACAVQGVGAGFLRGSVWTGGASAAPAHTLFVPLSEPITESVFIPPVDAATEASLRAVRKRREVAALLDRAPLLITGQVVMPLPNLSDLQICPLKNTTETPSQTLPLFPPRSPSLRSPLLRRRHHSTAWPLETHTVSPYMGPAERERMNMTDIEGIAICGVRVPWLGV